MQQTINISLNTAIKTRLKSAIQRKGYNNVSEYIRDLLRRDLDLEIRDNYPYDSLCLTQLAQEAKRDVKKKRVQKLQTSTNEITIMNQSGGAFDFLGCEPDIYSISDLKKRYV